MITADEAKADLINSYMNDPDFLIITQQIETRIREAAKNGYGQIYFLYSPNIDDCKYLRFNDIPFCIKFDFHTYTEDHFYNCTFSLTKKAFEKYIEKIITLLNKNGFDIDISCADSYMTKINNKSYRLCTFTLFKISWNIHRHK